MQQFAYTYSLTGMFKGYEMVESASFLLGYVCHGGHAILSVLAVFIDVMTVCALTSESSVLDIAALMNPTLHTSASGLQARRLRATREISKARGSPRP